MNREEKDAKRKQFREYRNAAAASEQRLRESKESGSKKRTRLLTLLVKQRQLRARLVEKRYEWDRKKANLSPEVNRTVERELDMHEARTPLRIAHIERQLKELDAEEGRERKSIAAAAPSPAAPRRAVPSAGSTTRKGKTISVPPKRISKTEMSHVVRYAHQVATKLSKRGGSGGVSGKTRVYHFVSGKTSFVLTVIESGGKPTAVSASYRTPQGTRSFASKRSGL